jgi:AraC-like DNA-binding protein
MEPYAWTSPYWYESHTFFSIVFYHAYLRFLWGSCDGGGEKPPPVHWHTSKGIDPAGFHVLQALNQLSRFPSQRCSGVPLVESLLRLAKVELDETVASGFGKAYQSYRAVCDYLNTHTHEPLSREAVATEFGISPSHISRLFQEQGGTSFSQYLLRMRMERAVSLLQQQERTIKEVGYYCGYRNDSYFIRTFKSYHGVSPGDWRNRAARQMSSFQR